MNLSSRKKLFQWWSRRLSVGCQLENIDAFTAGFHYKRRQGGSWWFSWVSRVALYHDYTMASGDYHTTPRQFSIAFHRLTGPLRMTVELRRPPRSISDRSYRRYTLLDSVEQDWFEDQTLYTKALLDAGHKLDEIVLTPEPPRGNINAILSGIRSRRAV